MYAVRQEVRVHLSPYGGSAHLLIPKTSPSPWVGSAGNQIAEDGQVCPWSLCFAAFAHLPGTHCTLLASRTMLGPSGPKDPAQVPSPCPEPAGPSLDHPPEGRAWHPVWARGYLGSSVYGAVVRAAMCRLLGVPDGAGVARMGGRAPPAPPPSLGHRSPRRVWPLTLNLTFSVV